MTNNAGAAVYDTDFELRPDTRFEPAKPSHAGHRQRLRARAAKAGTDTLPDYELLELLLFRSIPQRDVKPLARALIERFKTLPAVLGAHPYDLKTVSARDNHDRVMRVTDAIALDLKLTHEAACRMGAVKAARELHEHGAGSRPSISSWSALNDYVRTRLAHEAREQVRRALELSASALILVHNHPSGDPSPSSADIEMTRQVVEAARALNMAVHDHLVVGRDGVASFKALGLM
jgi:DNA repair protein RadC